MAQAHTISKLLIELQAPSADRAFDMQQAISNHCKELLPPLLSGWLDNCAGDDELLRIDRLEIKIGTGSWDRFINELPQLIIAALHKEYGHLLKSSFGIPGRSFEYERKPLRLGYFEYWLIYLEKGFLPPTANVTDKAAWENAVLETIATDHVAVEQCRDLLLKYPNALQRLSLQFSPVFLQSWAGAFHGAGGKESFLLLEEWINLITDTSFRLLAKQKINLLLDDTLTGMRYRDLLAITIHGLLYPQQKPITTALLEEFFAKCFSAAARPLWKQALIQVLPLYDKEFPVLKQLIEHAAWGSEETGIQLPHTVGNDKNDVSAEQSFASLRKTKEDPLDEKTIRQDLEAVISNENNLAANDSSAGNSSNMVTGNREEEDKSEETGDAPVNATKKEDDLFDGTNALLSVEERFRLFRNKMEGNAGEHRSNEMREVKQVEDGTILYVNNSGLVLLHPYLYPFFDSLGLLKDKQFKSDVSRDKAVQLLTFLAHGETGLQDDELVLPKLLCGLLPGKPVDRFIFLDDEEKKEATELLETVLQHWKALPNTSADGLRANFLLREGRLDFKNEQWNLQVTQQVYDILLNQLPWGFGTIKLPWMPWILTTLWV